jgi:thiamine-monophosphate kinase
MTEKATSLSDLGLYGLIEHFQEQYKPLKPSELPAMGEDASSLITAPDHLTSTTLLLEGINFDLTYTPFQHLGYKAVTVAVNDLLAMNARPSQISLNMGLSSKITLEMLETLMSGVFAACEHYQTELTAFKPAASLTGLSMALSVTGKANKKGLVTRAGAQPTDVICVTGDLGGALMGLHLLEREKRVLQSNDLSQPVFGNNEYVLKRQLKPEARMGIIDALEKLDIVPTAMTGISEGLATSLRLLCRSSKTGCRIYENKIPLHQNTLKAAKELNYNPLIAALNGGEDYELIFTLPLEVYEKNKDLLPETLSVMGYMTEEDKACRMITTADDEIDIKARGWGNLDT